ncbi:targeting protein for Xklp2 homolog isoform X2 [Patella vulgata]|uniref:targeting protein for Xklp2 homolog isoform X2 n=1 Tax=Patella vulgata TaxID=6465 RepID=UPI00218021AE|nr:targeting protein for Xklp2 homolog isoform X2 [Patella vulgata]
MMEGIDWSFNAPQYVDFEAPQPIDDDADKWFDHVSEDGKNLGELELNENEDKKENTKPNQSEDSDEIIEPCKGESKRLPNVLLPSEWNKKKTNNAEKTSSKMPQRVLKSAPLRQSPRLKNKPMKALPMVSPPVTEIGKPKMSKGSSMTNLHLGQNHVEGKKTLRKVESSTMLKRSSSLRSKRPGSCDGAPSRTLRTRGLSAEKPMQLKKPISPESQPASQKQGITFPTTPTFMKRKHTSVGATRVVKNSEEQALEKIEKFRKDLAEKRKQSDLSLKKLKATGCIGAVKGPSDDSTKTQPKSDNRIKGFFNAVKERISSSSSSKEDNNNKQMDKFESMAERIINFQNGTPDRFHSRPKDRCKGLKRLRSKSPKTAKLTIPHTPNFQSTMRTRTVKVPSRDELEEREIEEMQKNQFHAHPVNQKILEHTTGLKEVAKKPTTEPKAFHLSSDNRQKDKDTSRTKEEKVVFQAKPVNPKILEGVVGVKPAKEKATTVPQSPAFALKNRVRLPVEPSDEKHNTSNKARSVPHYGIPFQPKVVRKITVIEPFSFDSRDKERDIKKEAKIQQVMEEEQKAREFHAQPMPDLEEPVGIPPKNPKEITEPVPFEFEIDFRSSRRAEDTSSCSSTRFEEDMQVPFKAKPVTVIYQEPFIPKKSTKPLTDVTEFELNTERRAANRESFDNHIKHKEAEMEASKRQREHEEKLAYEVEKAKLRSETVHKANPVRHFAPVQVHPSNRPLTRPESPMFTDRFKI